MKDIISKKFQSVAVAERFIITIITYLIVPVIAIELVVGKPDQKTLDLVATILVVQTLLYFVTTIKMIILGLKKSKKEI